MQHTAGPWKVEPASRNTASVVIDGMDRDDLIPCPGSGGSMSYTDTVCWLDGIGDQQNANANLIAAAPDLLTEAEALVARIEEWAPDGLNDENFREWNGHIEPPLARLKDAIAKATGANVQ